jgi:hypothetical protein
MRVERERERRGRTYPFSLVVLGDGAAVLGRSGL